uniref:L1 transposable element RRM domain-containing protein n=1 Tax=Sus scrofa TaxID=9823 RepID=A0A8D1FRD3_PIG
MDVEQKREKRLKRNEKSLRELWDNVKHTNIHIIGVPEGEEREKGTEKIFQEIIAENFPNMGKEPLSQIQEAQRVPYKINPRRNTLRHILIKLTKIKDRENLESSYGKETNNIQGDPDMVISRFFSRNSADQKGVA